MEWTVPSLGRLQYNESGILSEFINAIVDLCIGLGVIIFLLFTLASRKVNNLLSHKAFLRLGSISYSFYLVHVLVLLSLVYLLNPYLPVWFILTLAPFIAILCAVAFHQYVEKPSISLGRKINKPTPVNRWCFNRT